MEKPATDIYTFGDLRRRGYTYVDKTDILWPLVNDSIGKQFFMARPRRFGKSLLISTLHSLFEGRRDLFQGLAIEPKWNWSKSWPVLHLDMTVETPTRIFIIEFKLDDTAANALKQIREKSYAEPYATSPKGVTLLGVGFSAEQRAITDTADEVLR